MFDQLLPPLYLQLRIKTELSQTRLAERLDVNRQTVANYESGATRPDADYERRLIEVAGCSPREVAQMLCELLGALIDLPVVILEAQEKEPEVPPTVLEEADREARELRRFIPPSMFRALANQIHITGMMDLVLKRQFGDLGEQMSDCRKAAGPHVPRCRTPAKQGATGPPASGPVSDNRTDGTPSARSQSKVEPKTTKGEAP